MPYSYRAACQRHPRLTDTEEQQLRQRIRDGDEQGRARLAEGCLGLALHIAGHYAAMAPEHGDDLQREGQISRVLTDVAAADEKQPHRINRLSARGRFGVLLMSKSR